MKKILLLFMIFLLVSCSSDENRQDASSEGSSMKEPPKIFLKYQDQTIEAVQVSYCLEVEKGEEVSVICVDTSGPLELIKHQIGSLTVGPQSTIQVVFEDYDTDYNLNYVDEDVLGEIIFTSDGFQVPDQTGEYIYELTASWASGSASYAFKIHVEE